MSKTIVKKHRTASASARRAASYAEMAGINQARLKREAMERMEARSELTRLDLRPEPPEPDAAAA